MNFSLTILGSSSATPIKNRLFSSQVLNFDNQYFLIDCGEGTQMQMLYYDINRAKIDNIFISHLHGDHYFGLFGLISTINLTGREKPLHIYAHEELHKMFKSEFFPVNPALLNFELVFHYLKDEKEKIYENKKIKIYSFPLKHSIKTCGFLFQQKKLPPNIIKEKITELNLTIPQILELKAGKNIIIDGKEYANEELTIPPAEPQSFAYCSDTSYDENIIPVIQNVDLLYHEASFCEKDTDLAEKYLHSTTAQAATIAQKANAKKLVIGHFSARYPNAKRLVNEAKAIFPNTIEAIDGLKIDISHDTC